MYHATSLTAPPSDLKKVKIGLVDTSKDRVYYVEEGLHEVLAREICKDRSYDWECNGKYYSAVDYLLERHDFIKLSNYGEGNTFRCLTVESKSHKGSKRLRDWLECLTGMLGLRQDFYTSIVS